MAWNQSADMTPSPRASVYEVNTQAHGWVRGNRIAAGVTSEGKIADTGWPILSRSFCVVGRTALELVKSMSRGGGCIYWFPGVRKLPQECREVFAAPVGLVPKGTVHVQARDIANGNACCLTFRKT
jgi:hypothetical protein